ncbi:MAG: hypothetical protein M3421_06750 [Bacteroidota bacterium]|nr:hypothetical protein [Bacteroidota bacterium]
MISSCGLSKRIYLTPEKKIALSPREYSAKEYKNLESHKKQQIQKRNRNVMVTLIVSANAIIFVPLYLSQSTDQQDR